MFTGEDPLYETRCHKFTDKVFFLDCHPVVFEEIYHWLRFGTVATCKTNETLKANVIQHAKEFHLFRLVKELANEKVSQERKTEKQANQKIESVFYSSTILNSKAASSISTNLGLKLDVANCSHFISWKQRWIHSTSISFKM